MAVHVRTCAELIVRRHECTSLKTLMVLSKLNRYSARVQYHIILLQVVVTNYSIVEIQIHAWEGDSKF